MLKNPSKGVLALAAVASLMGTAPASADVVNVIILAESYFPSTLYVKGGDTLIFTNESGRRHTVVGQNNQWTTGSISNYSDVTIVIDEDMHQSFSGEDATDSNRTISAQLEFGNPPLSD